MLNNECVCISEDDGEPTHWFPDKIIKARKEHECCECKEAIKKGDQYHSASCVIIGYGGHETYKTCMRCKAVRDDFFNCGYVPGEMWCFLREQWGEDAYLLDREFEPEPECGVRVCTDCGAHEDSGELEFEEYDKDGSKNYFVKPALGSARAPSGDQHEMGGPRRGPLYLYSPSKP